MLLNESYSFDILTWHALVENHFGTDTLARDSFLDYVAETNIHGMEHEFFFSDFLVEYETSETPLALCTDEELLEATLTHMFGDVKKVYKTDKDGKKITGMHKGTKRYKGSRKERVNAAVKEYYSDPKNAEAHREDMRRRYHEKKRLENAQKAEDDNKEAKEKGMSVDELKAERKKNQPKQKRAFHFKNRKKKEKPQVDKKPEKEKPSYDHPLKAKSDDDYKKADELKQDLKTMSRADRIKHLAAM